MALAHSPKIVTDGLVFAYDMANTQKSWKGAPTTNLITSPNPTTVGGAWGVTGLSAVILNSAGAPDGTLTATKLVASTNNATFQFIAPSSYSQPAGTITYSCFMKAGEYDTGSLFLTQSGNNGAVFNLTNGTVVSVTGTGNTAAITYVINGWYRCSVTNTGGTVSAGYRVGPLNGCFVNVGGDGVSGIYVWNCQAEQKAFATPFVNGTRSNSQAVIDLTGRRTVTVAGSPTYGSDGTFTFNSAGSTTLNLGSGSNFLPMPSLTFESWIKTPGLGSGMTVNGIWGFTYGIRFNADSNGNLYFIIGTDTTTFVNIGTSGVNVNDNSWHHIVAVKNGDTSCTIYLNGVARASGVPTAGWSGTNPWVAMDVQVGRDLNDAPYYFNGKIDIGRVYNRGLTAAEVQQNFNAIKMKYYGENPEVPATSGVNLKLVRPNLPSGFYWIKTNSMPNALRMYVDMSEEGGGYDFYPMQGTGISIGSTNGTHSGIALGLDLVYPRSKQHWTAMSNFVRNVLGSTGNEYFTTAYSVYRETSGGAGSRGGNYTGDIMRNPAFYGTGTPDWRVPDGGRWWLRDTTFGEPNGDYTAYNFLGGYSLPNPYTGQDIGFNDVTGQTYTTGTYYLLSTNTKP